MNSVICPLVQCSHVMLLFKNNAFVPCTMLTCDITVHPLKKKKKKNKQTNKQGFGNANPNPHQVNP